MQGSVFRTHEWTRKYIGESIICSPKTPIVVALLRVLVVATIGRLVGSFVTYNIRTTEGTLYCAALVGTS